MRLILCCFLAGCTAHTTVYNPSTGKPTFTTNANFAGMKLGADGSLTMVNVDHATMQREIAATITQRANGFAGLATALLAGGLLH